MRAADARLCALDPRERALLGPNATAKRRSEFAAGRAAARAALHRLLGERALGAVILRDEARRPAALGADGAPLAIVSITHAAGLAAAAAAGSPIGLDIVAIEPVERSFRDDAFLPGETEAWSAWLGSDDPSLAACAAFAAKEAALKWLGTGLSIPLLALRATPCGGRGPARHGAGIRSAIFPLRIEAPGVDARLDGWLAASARRVLVAACGPRS